MIISKTPFRISFFGGGTDFPLWYSENGGAVLSTTIDKYCYINCRYLPPVFDYKYRIRYTLQEEVRRLDEIKHPSVRETIRYLQIPHSLEIQHNADVPANSGLGSSSSFTVGLCNALNGLTGNLSNVDVLARAAIEIEQDHIKECVGSQDQMAAAHGGFNRIDFGPGDIIRVCPITLSNSSIHELENHLALFFTGFQRYSSDIAQDQLKRIDDSRPSLRTMTELLEEAYSLLGSSRRDWIEFGRLLDEQWKLKQSLSPRISNETIDRIYDTAKVAGAIGGKLLGAGGGGFFLFLIEPEKRQALSQALKGLAQVPFGFSKTGSEIIYYTPSEPYELNGE